VTIQYVPVQSGIHELNLSYNAAPVEGTPVRINVDATDNGHFVSAYGPGLFQGSSGERLQFCITQADAEISIEGPGKADIVHKEVHNGVLVVDYVPVVPGEYLVNIKSHGKHIHGSPFSAKISGEGRKRSQLSVPASSEYTLGGNDVDLTNMVGHIRTPYGTVEPCLLKKMPNGKLGFCGFQPKKKGTYAVDVVQDGAKFPGSPFQIQVGDGELCSASKVKVTGAIPNGVANKWNEILINVMDAGFGSLTISTEGSHRVDMNCKNTSITGLRGEYTLKYKPQEPGIYLLNIKYGDDHIAGSPFMLSISGEPSGRVRETASKQIQAAEMVAVGQPSVLQLKLPGASPLDMEAMLTTPSGSTELCEIRDQPDNLFDIRFTPTEAGTNILSLKQKGIHIAGSPLQYTVGKTPSGGTHKVEFGGTGADRGSLGVKNEFNVYTHEAGPGLLYVAIDGPSKAKIDIHDTGSGFVTVSYVVEAEGEYRIVVKYNDEHVPKSPRVIQVDPQCEEAKLVTIHGLRDRGLEVDKPATFTVNFNGARGTLKGHVDTPSGAHDDLFIQELDNELNSCRFLPKENGVYYVHLKFNEAHIPGSPFPMLVGKLGADPALVLAQGAGLEKGLVGQPSKFNIVTTSAGSGTLGVMIEGPAKVAIICTEVEDGYEFTYSPTAPGDYMISIKYCNVTIAGCPYKAVVLGSGKASEMRELSGLYVETVEKKPGLSRAKSFMGDASKVIIQGTGLKKGFIGRAATFSLDVKEAGQALLTVAMISSNGMPVKELSYKKQKPGVYNVTYLPEEKGDHILTVRWGTNDVPGSPYVINVS
jgi:filamin